MYNSYFGFSESPFNITPNSRFYFRNPSCDEVLKIVRHGIETRKGIIVVTGDAGTGKTLLLKYLVRDLSPKIRTIIAFNPHTDIFGLLRLLLNRLDLRAATDDTTAMFDRLKDYLIEQRRNGRIVCLLIDEAQDLHGDTLDELRLLSNMDFEDEALLPVVLLGQPELNAKLDRPSAKRIKQRVALTRHIYPLIRKEVGPYIEFRLRVANYAGPDLFEANAIEKIATYSGGTPRIVNSICDNALIRAFTANQSVISAKLIDQVARELRIIAPLSTEKRFVSPDFYDVSHRRAPSTDISESVVNELAHSPAKAPVVDLVEVANTDSKTDTLKRSGSPTIPSREASEHSGEFWQVDTGSVMDSKAPSKSDPDLMARLDRLSAFDGWPGLRDRVRPFRSRWFALVVATGLLILTIGRMVYSWQIADIFAVAAIGKRTLGPYASTLPSKQWLLTQNKELNGSPVEFSPPQPATVDLKTKETPHSQTSKQMTTTLNSAANEIYAKQVELSQNSQPPSSQDGDPQRKQAASDGVADRWKSAPQNVNLRVIGASVVRDNPRSNAKIIATLEPGTRVTVLARSRDYYRVRSMDNKTIRGYVHREDAFFEQKQ
jgi:type II secretory pathway predicted ATPase ExeA